MRNQENNQLKYVYWIPRIMGVLFIGFLSLFALDVFTPGKTISYYAVALFMHLIPNIILALLLFIAWKYERVGGILFILLAIGFTLFFRTYGELTSFLFVSFPIYLIGLLFLIESYLEVK